jgi:hypothetical protein
MAQATAKVKNGSITLPDNLKKSWKGEEVFVFSNEDTVIFKKTLEPVGKLSDIAARISLPKLRQKEIDSEIKAYRSGR